MEVGFGIPKSLIPDFTSKYLPDSRTQISLHGGKTEVEKDKMAQSILSSKMTDLFSQGSSHNA